MRLKKDITFIYMDRAEQQIYEPILAEAKKRGYTVRMTADKFAKCEIGFYCQHVNFPQYSKFSVIMLHDVIQQYDKWPDIWFREPWNKYDVGFLPGKKWHEMWQQTSKYFYSRPRHGVYEVGWSKADILSNIDRTKLRSELAEKYGLDLGKRTVLYAPAWENDNKQDDFVNSVLGLDINILIKQHAYNKNLFPVIYDNVKKMRKMHEGIADVFQLDSNVNIVNAIAMSDILVSEESSTMCEAVMMGIPAISVSDWLIPDVTPSRYPRNDYDFVTVTQKAHLRECIKRILNSYEDYRTEAQNYSNENFLDIGNASHKIMNIIDCIIEERKPLVEKIKPKELEKLPIQKLSQHLMLCLKRELASNYSERFKILQVAKHVYKYFK